MCSTQLCSTQTHAHIVKKRRLSIYMHVRVCLRAHLSVCELITGGRLKNSKFMAYKFYLIFYNFFFFFKIFLSVCCLSLKVTGFKHISMFLFHESTVQYGLKMLSVSTSVLQLNRIVCFYVIIIVLILFYKFFINFYFCFFIISSLFIFPLYADVHI